VSPRWPDHHAIALHLDNDHRLAGIDGHALAHGVDQRAVDEHRAAGQHFRLGDADSTHQRPPRVVRLHLPLAGQVAQKRLAHRRARPVLQRQANHDRHGEHGNGHKAEPRGRVAAERDDQAPDNRHGREEPKDSSRGNEDFQHQEAATQHQQDNGPANRINQIHKALRTKGVREARSTPRSF
jgi:hypothetical protein